ncbi:agouti-related protein [Pelobates fuscus]|uniref:agouti-related protein n=1 Tax=Pelobates fuscus TaxID=191477 RepID=UPI002FE4DB1C
MMFNTVLLCLATVHAIQAILTSESGNGRLQALSSSASNGRYYYPSLLHNMKDPQLPETELAKSELMRLEAGIAEEDQMEDYSLLDPRALSLEVASREERSPRRCVQLLESCVGHLPCCSPCATCYCRFFNAFCYCKKTSTNCHQGKN